MYFLYVKLLELASWCGGKAKKPLVMAVFLAGGLLTTGLVYPSFRSPVPVVERGVLGGPTGNSRSNETLGAAISGIRGVALVYANGGNGYVQIRGFSDGHSGLVASLTDPGQPPGPTRDNLFIYKVQKGDTLSGIAAYFGISIDTVVNANPRIRANLIKPGDELSILPTSGAVYKTRDGDTLESISGYFGVPETEIARFNKSVNFGALGQNTPLVIPGVRNFSLTSSRAGPLPSLTGYFAKPADGFNWGILHPHNAVDISNACGTPVYASAEGLVIPDENFGDGRGSWNGGYGSFVLIEHPQGAGVRTRYAHLDKVSVEIGNYVKQGQQIGTMGQTGDATGCHVHFEVYGAENPFAK